MKVIIAGGRDFNNNVAMLHALTALQHKGIIRDPCELVCGMARGADLLAYSIWKQLKGTIHEFKPDWDGPRGKGAALVRNCEMGRFADKLVAFWDGKSTGTKHMIKFMKSIHKPVYVYDYDGVPR